MRRPNGAKSTWRILSVVDIHPIVLRQEACRKGVELGVAPKGITLSEVALAGAPYIGCSLILLALLIAVPEIAIGLPSLVR
ncbi:MAG: hypothetical protein RID42_01965 [Alphaproteobacteria bacterium]